MKPIARKFFVIVLLIFFRSPAVNGSWKNIATFGENAVCGFFWDEFHGLVGFGGDQFSPAPTRIRITTDGGATWTLSNSPPAFGRVTSIFMRDALTGYASIFESSIPASYSVWKTTNGGSTWFDNSHGNTARTNCVYATSNVLVRTVWFDSNIGGISTDDGISYLATFRDPSSTRSNGIDFADDLHGVVTMGPPPGGNQPWYTTDGGLSWNQGDPLPESWSVYAQKGTPNFILLAEDNMLTPGQTVFMSTNGGINWFTRFVFPGSPQFTGHIAGIGSRIYVQTDTAVNQGMFRSDDMGLHWTNIGGPSNNRDTRFVVTGCQGEVIYAFDNFGNIWKSTDDGDGSIAFTPRVGPIASIFAGDTTRIPIFIDSTRSFTSVIHYSGALTLNSDLLTPFSLDTTGTLSKGVIFDTMFWISPRTVFFSVDLKTPLQSVSFSTPLLYIRATAYVTSEDSTVVSLGSTVGATGSNGSPVICSEQDGMFVLKNNCGYSTLRHYLGGKPLVEILSVVPNPARNRIQVELKSGRLPVDYQLIDQIGTLRKTGQANDPIFTIDTDDLPDGDYYLRIGPQGTLSAEALVVIVR